MNDIKEEIKLKSIKGNVLRVYETYLLCEFDLSGMPLNRRIPIEHIDPQLLKEIQYGTPITLSMDETGLIPILKLRPKDVSPEQEKIMDEINKIVKDFE
jgi:hypothetical protein